MTLLSYKAINLGDKTISELTPQDTERKDDFLVFPCLSFAVHVFLPHVGNFFTGKEFLHT